MPAGVGISGEDHQGRDNGFAVLLGWDDRHRRRLHDGRDHRELLGGRVCRGDQPSDHLGACRQQEHAAEDSVDLVEPETQPGRDPEVAAAAPKRPEEIGVTLLVHHEELAVRGDDLSAEEVVDREPVLAHEEADAAAQGDSADADGGRVAEPGHEAVFTGRLGVLAGLHARLCPGRAALGVDLDRIQRGEVEDDPALGGAVARAAVAAAAHRELGPGVPCQVDHAGDVGGIGCAHDRGGPAVDSGEEDASRVVVLGVFRSYHSAVQRGA